MFTLPAELLEETTACPEFKSQIGKQLFNFYDLQSDGYRSVEWICIDGISSSDSVFPNWRGLHLAPICIACPKTDQLLASA